MRILTDFPFFGKATDKSLAKQSQQQIIRIFVDHELEVEDLYPDYEELEEESDKIPMLTVGEVITRLQVM